MSQRVVECVPNFSEGRDPKALEQILDAIRGVEGAKILDVDSGYDTHRTVVTILGDPEATLEAAFRAIEKAARVIDMRKHRGAHPRHGATDVCPFVPVAGVTMEECVELAKRLGRRVGEELGLPVYLYDQAAQVPERRSLAHVRKGEYEALPAKLAQPAWKPDFGPARFVPETGVVTIGAREFLIAYNVNLNSSEQEHALDLAFEIREKGRGVRRGQRDGFYRSGEVLKYSPARHEWPCAYDEETFGSRADLAAHLQAAHGLDLEEELRFHELDPENLEGQTVRKRGLFRECRAVGWLIPEYRRAQVSINLTNFKVTPTHEVLEACRRLAAERGLVVTGSEVVGLIPFDAIRASGEFYLSRRGSSRGIPVRDVVETAVQSLGLRDVGEFDLESVLGMPTTKGPLTGLAVHELADEVSRPSPAPGGGSIAALAGSLGAALASMVANLTFAKPQADEKRAALEEIAMRCQGLKDDLLRAVDADTDAFGEVIAAQKLPRGDEARERERNAAIQSGYQKATSVPKRTAELCLEALRACRSIAELGMRASITDAGVGALMAWAGLQGAVYNVRINLGSIEDVAWKTDVSASLASMLEEGLRLNDEVAALVERGLGAT